MIGDEGRGLDMLTWKIQPILAIPLDPPSAKTDAIPVTTLAKGGGLLYAHRASPRASEPLEGLASGPVVSFQSSPDQI